MCLKTRCVTKRDALELATLRYDDEDVIDKANETILDKFLEQASIEHQIDNHDIF